MRVQVLLFVHRWYPESFSSVKILKVDDWDPSMLQGQLELLKEITFPVPGVWGFHEWKVFRLVVITNCNYSRPCKDPTTTNLFLECLALSRFVSGYHTSKYFTRRHFEVTHCHRPCSAPSCVTGTEDVRQAHAFNLPRAVRTSSVKPKVSFYGNPLVLYVDSLYPQTVITDLCVIENYL